MAVGAGSVGEWSVGEQYIASAATINLLATPTITVTVPAPTIATGVSIGAPVSTISISKSDPVVNTGVSVASPVAGPIVIASHIPTIRTGLVINVPVSTITLSAPTPDINTGVSIAVQPWRVLEDSGGAVGEYAVAEGGIIIPARIRTFISEPFIASGASIQLPSAATIIFSAPDSEISARHRAVRIRQLTS